MHIHLVPGRLPGREIVGMTLPVRPGLQDECATTGCLLAVLLLSRSVGAVHYPGACGRLPARSRGRASPHRYPGACRQGTPRGCRVPQAPGPPAPWPGRHAPRASPVTRSCLARAKKGAGRSPWRGGPPRPAGPWRSGRRSSWRGRASALRLVRLAPAGAGAVSSGTFCAQGNRLRRK